MLLIEELLISPRCLLITVFVVAFLGWLFAVKLYTPCLLYTSDAADEL